MKMGRASYRSGGDGCLWFSMRRGSKGRSNSVWPYCSPQILSSNPASKIPPVAPNECPGKGGNGVVATAGILGAGLDGKTGSGWLQLLSLLKTLLSDGELPSDVQCPKVLSFTLPLPEQNEHGLAPYFADTSKSVFKIGGESHDAGRYPVTESQGCICKAEGPTQITPKVSCCGVATGALCGTTRLQDLARGDCRGSQASHS